MADSIFSVEFLLTRYKEAMVEYSRLLDAKIEVEKQLGESAAEANQRRAQLFKAAGI